MKIEKKILLFCFNLMPLFAFCDSVPMLFDLHWGAGLEDVKSAINSLSDDKGSLKYYNVFEGRNEMTDLRSQASIKYYTDDLDYNNIPSRVVFTFYNPQFKKSGLQLSKIEVFMKRKDNDNVWVDIKAVFEDILKKFIDDYLVNIDAESELKIYKLHEYQVVVNSIYIHFIANIGNNILDNDTSIYISYENNGLENLILKKEKELLENY